MAAMVAVQVGIEASPPQSLQSVPKSQNAFMLPGPPSSQTLSFENPKGQSSLQTQPGM